MSKQLIRDEKFTNIQKAQAGLTRLFEDAQKTSSFYRVLKNDEPLGVLIPNDIWDNLLEDLEALSSTSYLSRIVKARSETKGSSLEEIKKKLAL